MSRDIRLYLDDIAECTARILEYSEHMDFTDFLANKMAYVSVHRRMVAAGYHGKKTGKGFYDYSK